MNEEYEYYSSTLYETNIRVNHSEHLTASFPSARQQTSGPVPQEKSIEPTTFEVFRKLNDYVLGSSELSYPRSGKRLARLDLAFYVDAYMRDMGVDVDDFSSREERGEIMPLLNYFLSPVDLLRHVGTVRGNRDYCSIVMSNLICIEKIISLVETKKLELILEGSKLYRTHTSNDIHDQLHSMGRWLKSALDDHIWQVEVDEYEPPKSRGSSRAYYGTLARFQEHTWIGLH